ncbi:MAG: hypothetical protein WKF75_07855 [Singulisphaera sp.]
MTPPATRTPAVGQSKHSGGRGGGVEPDLRPLASDNLGVWMRAGPSPPVLRHVAR